MVIVLSERRQFHGLNFQLRWPTLTRFRTRAAMSMARVIGRYFFGPSVAQFGMYVTVHISGRHFLPGFGRTCHETVVNLRRTLSYCHPVNRIAERCGSVANRNRGRHLSSQHHGRSAEASGKATTEAGAGGNSCISPDSANRSNIGFARSNHRGARFNIREACQAGESQQQLQRWLRNKLQVRQSPLDWM
jgi:hypothetical protein